MCLSVFETVDVLLAEINSIFQKVPFSFTAEPITGF